MKRLLLLLLITLNLLYAKSIIIGTYSTEDNARNQLKEVFDTIEQKPEMIALQQSEGFDYVVRKLAQYYVVSVEPFAHDTELFEALKYTRQNFPDAYIHIPTSSNPLEDKLEEKPTIKVSEADSLALVTTDYGEEITPMQDVVEEEEIYISDEDAALNEVVSSATQEDDMADMNSEVVVVTDAVVVEATPVSQPVRTPAIKKEINYLQMLAKLPQEYLLAGGGIVVLLLLMLILGKRSGVKKEQRGLPDLEIEHEETVAETMEVSESVDDAFSSESLEASLEENTVVEDDFSLSEEDENALNSELDAFDTDIGDLDDLDDLEEENTVVAPITPSVSRKKRDPKNTHGEIHKDNFKDFKGLRVLVAEDNIINQKVLNGMLNESGMDIVMAENGQEALDILENDANFALILMDAHMPIMDGYDATRAVRADARFEAVAVVALTGDVASDDIRKLYECGMEGHLEKPIHMGALYDVFYTYSQAQEVAEVVEEEVYEDDDIEMDIEESVSSEVSAGMMALHTSDGLEAAGGDKELYIEILQEFVEMYKDADVKIQNYIEQNSINEATALLLDIKGLAGSIGGKNLEAASQELRSALLREDMLNAQDLQHRFHRELRTILEDILEYK